MSDGRRRLERGLRRGEETYTHQRSAASAAWSPHLQAYNVCQFQLILCLKGLKRFKTLTPLSTQQYTVLPPSSETLAIACIGQDVSTELELGHGCRVYG